MLSLSEESPESSAQAPKNLNEKTEFERILCRLLCTWQIDDSNLRLKNYKTFPTIQQSSDRLAGQLWTAKEVHENSRKRLT